jgi:hypothetical protein
MQRLVVKNMLREWAQKYPGRIESIFSGICNVAGSQLADPALFDFAGLEDRLVNTSCDEPTPDAAELEIESPLPSGL